MNTKYDLRAVRERVSRGWHDVACDFSSDENLDHLDEYLAYHWPPNIWVALAKSLYLTLRRQCPYDLPAPRTDSPYLQVRLDLTRNEDDPAAAWGALIALSPRRSQQVHLIFSAEGVRFVGERFRRVWGWDWCDPGVWDGIRALLAEIGCPCDWVPEEAFA
ncbi:MAG: hypothetical protein U0871_07120 [Gemmataceae bacterium]